MTRTEWWAEKSIVNVFFDDFQSTTCHVSLSYGLNLLQSVLLAEWVESVVDSVKKFNQLTAGVLLDNLIETFDVDKNDSDFTLSFWEVFLSILDSRSNQARNQNVDNRLKLLQLLDVSKLSDEADLLLDLVPVSVVSPKEDVQCYGQSLPNKLNRTVFGICDVLNRRQTDV